MTIFQVHVRMEDGQRLRAGELAMEPPKPNGDYRSAFRYAADWLAHPDAFALDPESLPLERGEFSGARLGPPLGVFDDALPDRWGRELLFRSRPRSLRSDRLLVELRGCNGLGALEFEVAGAGAQTQTQPPAEASGDGLDALLATAAAFEAGKEVDPADFSRLLAAGSGSGGARPKAIVGHDGRHWIAKFPSRVLDGRFDIVALEKASLDCARAAGLVTPDSRIQVIGGRKVLLVERFDTTEAGRRHMISFATLCRERNDFKVTHYDQLAAMLRRVSGEPAHDVGRLFRQALFNGVLGNTDDHLKNFAMLRIGRGYRLAPAYDLLPDTARNGESVLFYATTRFIDAMDTIDAMAGRWGVSDHRTMVAQVIDAVRDFKTFAVAATVPVENIDEIGIDVERRLARIGVAPNVVPGTQRPP